MMYWFEDHGGRAMIVGLKNIRVSSRLSGGVKEILRIDEFVSRAWPVYLFAFMGHCCSGSSNLTVTVELLLFDACCP